MSDRLQELEVFLRAADTGSFSRAARELGLSQPSVSRIVSALEQRLGVKLLLRTTRRVTLTDAGRLYLEKIRPTLLDLEEARALARGAGGFKGVLRVALSISFGIREVVPRIREFMAAHPELRIELLMADQRQNLVEEGADVAIRLGPLPDSAFVSRRIAKSPRLAIAAPAYLAAQSVPETPADLANHACIVGPGSSAAEGWVFRRADGTSIAVEPRVRVLVTAAEGVTACARAGLGIAIASLWICRRELEAGELTRILPAFALAPVEAYAVLTAGRRTPAKTRAFVDFLAASLRD